MKMEEVPTEEEKYWQSKKSFRESAAKQFWKYINDSNVLEVFQPALTLLYELPIKPDNIYEYLAEFLENGAQDLVKISYLQTELCYKHSELQQLYRAYPDLWRQASPPDDVGSLGDVGSYVNLHSMSKELGRVSAATGSDSGSGSLQNLDFMQLEDLGVEYASHSRRSKLKIFKLDEDEVRFREELEAGEAGDAVVQFYPLYGDTKFFGGHFAKPPKITPLTTKLEKIDDKLPETSDTESQKPREVKGKRKQKKDAGDDTKQKGSKQGAGDNTKRKGSKRDGGEDTKQKGSKAKGKRHSKGDQKQKESEQIRSKDEETMTGASLLEIPPIKKRAQIRTSHRRISKLVAGIEDSDERLAMENVLLMISDHKKMDPNGILFDFNRRHSEKEYELELFARGASEDLLRRLSQSRKSTIAGPQNTTDHLPDRESLGLVESGTPEVRKLSEEEVKEILTEQNHRRLIRDGLAFMHDVRKETRKHRRVRRKNRLHPSCVDCLQPPSDSESTVSSDEDTAKTSEQFLRMLTETFDDSVSSGFGPVCSTAPVEVFDATEVEVSLDQPEIVVTSAEEKIKEQEQQSSAISAIQRHRLKPLSRKKLHLIIGDLYAEYKKHLDFVHSVIKPHGMSIYVSNSPEAYEKELEKRFQSSMLLRRDETLMALIGRLNQTLLKSRKVRVKNFLKRRGNCKNIGYTKLEPFSETKRKEELHRDFAITVPAISEKEFQYFLDRFQRSRKSLFNSEGLRTKVDFVYDFPLAEVKATQRWIDKTFPESVFQLNEPLGDPADEHDFEDDDDDNYIWVEDFKNEVKGQPAGQAQPAGQEENLPIPAKDLKLIQEYLRDSQTCADDDEEQESLITNERTNEVECLEESKLPKRSEIKYSPSVLSLLQTRSLRKPYAELKRSERARRYVQKAFNPVCAEAVLNQFPFELLDDD